MNVDMKCFCVVFIVKVISLMLRFLELSFIDNIGRWNIFFCNK